MGTILAHAAIREGKEVIFRPVYAGKMRGGRSNCIVSISDLPIASPIVDQYDAVIALTLPSLKKFEFTVKQGGILIWESTTIKEPPTRTDIRVYAVPAYMKAAAVLKNTKVTNMIMLGALVKINPLVNKESLMAALKETLPGRHHDLIPLNEKAIELGMNLV